MLRQILETRVLVRPSVSDVNPRAALRPVALELVRPTEPLWFCVRVGRVLIILRLAEPVLVGALVVVARDRNRSRDQKFVRRFPAGVELDHGVGVAIATSRQRCPEADHQLRLAIRRHHFCVHVAHAIYYDRAGYLVKFLKVNAPACIALKIHAFRRFQVGGEDAR